jgi:hypothetical protein
MTQMIFSAKLISILVTALALLALHSWLGVLDGTLSHQILLLQAAQPSVVENEESTVLQKWRQCAKYVETHSLVSISKNSCKKQPEATNEGKEIS